MKGGNVAFIIGAPKPVVVVNGGQIDGMRQLQEKRRGFMPGTTLKPIEFETVEEAACSVTLGQLMMAHTRPPTGFLANLTRFLTNCAELDVRA